MGRCFIPKCEILCKDNPCRMKFKAPKDTEMFLEWKRVLPNKREFTRRDRVCERHFTKDDIITTFDYIINGKLLKVKCERPCLKPNAVPSLNLEIDPKILEKPPAKRTSRGTAARRIVEREDKNITTSASEEEYVVPTEPPEVIDLTTEPKPKTKSPPKEHEVETIEEKYPFLEQFKYLYDKVFEVTLPSTLWGIHREPERRFIAFTEFDVESMQNSKCVVLHSNGDLIVSVHRKKEAKNITTSASEEEYVVPTEPPEVIDLTTEAEKPQKNCPPEEHGLKTIEEESVFLEQYESLYDNVFEVTLPSTLWSIHREPERRFIAFTEFDVESMQNNKCLVLHSNGCLKVSLPRIKLSEQVSNTELIAESISRILNKIKETRPCAGSKSGL